MTNKSRKLFAFEYVKQGAKMRILVPETATKYDPEKHFMSHEESDYLADTLKGVPYATYKTDDRDKMEDLLQNGFVDPQGSVWKSFFAFWKDQEGHAFLVPEAANVQDLRDVEVFTFMKTQADSMKVGKYANRLFAALPKSEATIDAQGKVQVKGLAVWGKEVSWNEFDNKAVVRVDVDGEEWSEEDRELSILYVDLKGLSDEQTSQVDGSIVVSEKACRVLGLSKEPRLGMAWRGTFGTERGLGKGHILYKNDMMVDVVIYGPKTIVRTAKFFFGSMGELHVGVPHTDRQAFVNFHYHRPGLAVELAKNFMLQVMEASKNEAGLRRLFLKHTKDMKHVDMDQEGWILRRALAYGVSFLRFPGLYRRVVRYLAGPDSPVFQCDQRARIPMDTIAGYGYVLPDPNAIDSEGNVVLENAIPEGYIVFPDLAPGTKVVCYRQPSENTNAWVALTVTSKPEFKRFAGRGICLLGRGAHKVLGRLGGGDMDDQFIIVHDPKWVEAFHTMRPYPETEKLTLEAPQGDLNAYEEPEHSFKDELLEGIRDHNLSYYSNRHVSWQIEMARNARSGIGPVVNYGMMDLLMSDPDHRASMMADLSNDPMASGWLEEYGLWEYPGDDLLEGTTPYGYHARKFMTNLELVIDGNVKDTTLLKKLGDVSGAIKQFHENCKVYPESAVLSNRIPDSKIKSGDFTSARSLFCRSLETIRRYRDQLHEAFTEREWALVTPADRDLRNEYPFEREIAIRVRGEWKRTEDNLWERVDDTTLSLMDIWAQEWRAEMAKEGKHTGAYERICGVISDELMYEDDEMMERIAVEIYYQTYKRYENTPKIDEATGNLRNFNDGLLWSPVFGNHFINALRQARLSGFYRAVEIRPEFRKRLMDKSEMVQVRDHQVYIQDSEDEYTVWVGFLLGKSPDGKFRMDSGIIEYRKPQPICLPENPLLMGQRPLTRIIPSKVKPTKEETQQTQEPKGFGKILNKALGILGLEKKSDK